MLASIPSAVLHGVDGIPVSVEVHVSNGLPGFTVVGLPDAAVRESRDRVRAALLSTGLTWPLRRVTVNLAPSGVRKGGAGLDLPIAVGLLVAAGELAPASVDGLSFAGELGLDGSLRPVPGALVVAGALAGTTLVLPEASAAEALGATAGEVRCASHLGELVGQLRGRRPWRHPDPPPPVAPVATEPAPDLAGVRGQALGRRALEVAAAGGHHLLLVGPPGSGKTMMATCLPGILPPLAPQVALEVRRIHSAAGLGPPAGLPDRPPLRAPHPGASAVSLLGGGAPGMRPGEISLAHGGVLFLDEMGEFPATVLDALRQPLEEGRIRVSRARATVDLPARFLLAGAMNPCPCGEGGTPGACRCSESARARYHRRLSGPLLDRFDIAVRVERPEAAALVGPAGGEPSAPVAGRVAAARRFAAGRNVECNARLAAAELDSVAPLTTGACRILSAEVQRGALTGRGVVRVRRVARTIADLEGEEGPVRSHHMDEALLLRCRRDLLLGAAR